MSPNLDLTPDERRAIKGALRRAFRQSPRMREVLQRARVELPPALKKDGTPGIRPQVRYTCAQCKLLFQQKNVAVDHILPVVPLGKKEEDMTPTELVKGIFCSQDNLQVLCCTPIKNLPKGQRSCHAKKTNEENFIRDGLQKGWSLDQCRGAYARELINKQLKIEEKEKRKLAKLAKKNSTIKA